MAYSRTKGAIVASDGFYLGKKNTENALVESMNVSFASASTAQTVAFIAPFAGTVKSCYAFAGGATQVGTYTIIHGSAGATIATITATSGSLGTVTAGVVVSSAATVTAGEYISVTRDTCVATGVSMAIVNLAQTA